MMIGMQCFSIRSKLCMSIFYTIASVLFYLRKKITVNVFGGRWSAPPSLMGLGASRSALSCLASQDPRVLTRRLPRASILFQERLLNRFPQLGPNALIARKEQDSVVQPPSDLPGSQGGTTLVCFSSALGRSTSSPLPDRC
ncbi:unnamed protein product [Prunus armeniaca]